MTPHQEEEALDPTQYFENRCKAMAQLEVRWVGDVKYI